MEPQVLCKLTQHPGPHGAVIRIEGHLGPGALRKLQTLIRQASHPVTLDLTGLTSLDNVGRRFLANQRRRGHLLLGASLYIDRLIQEFNS